MKEEKKIGPISRGSIENPFGGPRYDSDFKRETTYGENYLKPYNPEVLKSVYTQNQFKADN